jgi:hypothetical protein
VRAVGRHSLVFMTVPCASIRGDTSNSEPT